MRARGKMGVRDCWTDQKKATIKGGYKGKNKSVNDTANAQIIIKRKWIKNGENNKSSKVSKAVLIL